VKGVASLRRYLAGLAGSADADDLPQDVIVIIIRKLGSLQS
jgi:DNA-directed RNA polymerase specialized sigma24 family protein